MIAISAVSCWHFVIVIGGQMISKYSTLADLREQERKLKNQYKKELQLSEELKDQEEYVKQMIM